MSPVTPAVGRESAPRGGEDVTTAGSEVMLTAPELQEHVVEGQAHVEEGESTPETDNFYSSAPHLKSSIHEPADNFFVRRAACNCVLHQLRQHVGHSAETAYCNLQAAETSEDLKTD
jgi:hypothetical protein